MLMRPKTQEQNGMCEHLQLSTFRTLICTQASKKNIFKRKFIQTTQCKKVMTQLVEHQSTWMLPRLPQSPCKITLRVSRWSNMVAGSAKKKQEFRKRAISWDVLPSQLYCRRFRDLYILLRLLSEIWSLSPEPTNNPLFSGWLILGISWPEMLLELNREQQWQVHYNRSCSTVNFLGTFL